MFNKLLFLGFSSLLVQSTFAADFIHGKKIDLKNGRYGEVQLQVNDDGSYMSLVRELGGDFSSGSGNGPIFCETKQVGYWERNDKGLILLWGLGQAKFESCFQDRVCLNLDIGKNIPVAGGHSVSLKEVLVGGISPIESLPRCK